MEEKMPTVKIEFWDLPNLIMTKEEYEMYGKFKGLIKDGAFRIYDVKKVHHILMSPSKYPTQPWEG